MGNRVIRVQVRIARRTLLALAGAGALSAALPACGSDDDEPYELTSYGYDSDVTELGTPEGPKPAGALPAKSSVNTDWLPPVGRQTMPNCFVWATVYGLATFHAARTTNTPPSTPARRAGPDYAYIRYQLANKLTENTCKGGQMVKCLNWLQANGGTPSLAAAPNIGRRKSTSSCEANWANYGPRTIAPDPLFGIPGHKLIRITGADGVNNLKSVIAGGNPVAFGINLYSDFPHYRGTPSPYVGNGQWMINASGRKAGHVMVITGYDDNTGAVRIQNSFGKRWGDRGFMWMSYETLAKTAQGTGVYVPDPA